MTRLEKAEKEKDEAVQATCDLNIQHDEFVRRRGLTDTELRVEKEKYDKKFEELIQLERIKNREYMKALFPPNGRIPDSTKKSYANDYDW